MRRGGVVRRAPAVALLALLAASADCKNQQSLVVVALTSSNAAGSALRSVRVSIVDSTKNFALPNGLSTTPFTVGVYVSATGSLNVSAIATGGGLCYTGTALAKADTAGTTANITVPMAPGTGCDTTDGGAADGGSTVLPPPSLTQCTEYMHNDPSDPPCDDANGISNWSIWSLAFSPDGHTLVTAGDDGRVKVWGWDGSKLSETGHVLTTSSQTWVAYSPDGTRLAVGSVNGADVYETSSWTISATLTGISTVYDIGWSPDSQQVVSIDSNGIYVHSLAAPNAPAFEALSAGPYALAVSPVGTTSNLLAGVSFFDGTAGVLNIKSSPLGTASTVTVTSDTTAATTIRFSPDGTMLASGGDDGVLHFWNVPLTSTTPVGNPIMFSTNGNTNAVHWIAFAPGGATFAVAAGSTNFGGYASVWNTTSVTNMTTTPSPRGRVTPTYFPVSVAFSPDGAALAIGEVTCGLVMICADSPGTVGGE